MKPPLSIRIIAGKFRGRKIEFVDQPDLRPTPNRIRETLFNWLAPVIEDAYCLDLFSGSGALGLEALSRRAKQTTFIDQSTAVIQQINSMIQKWEIENAIVQQANIPGIIPKLSKPYNIIFLDPPFHQDFIRVCCEWLEKQDWVAPNAYLYIEAESTLNLLPISNHWKILRSKKAGQVGYHLLQKC